ncbi:unnamed protein product [Amoebophrya sp. A25]|nr:unnamed protein product [Amoebophrya sp. A25]|eukprot:GSA25T00003650001.1
MIEMITQEHKNYSYALLALLRGISSISQKPAWSSFPTLHSHKDSLVGLLDDL